MASRIFLQEQQVADLAKLLDLTDENLFMLRGLMEAHHSSSLEDLCVAVAEELDIPSADASDIVPIVAYMSESNREAIQEDPKAFLEALAGSLGPQHADAARRLRKAQPPVLELFGPLTEATLSSKKHDLEMGLIGTAYMFKAYCDLRPVFDENRDRILDHVVVTTVKTFLTDDEDDEQAVVFQLNEDGLSELKNLLGMVEKKVAIIKEHYSGTVPGLGAGAAEGDE